MAIQLWHGLQAGPVLDTFTKIVESYNANHIDCPIELTHFEKYGDPPSVALSKSEEEQPHLVLAPEFTTSAMMNALKEKKLLPGYEFLDPDKLSDIADIVKRTFGDEDGNLNSLPLNPSCGVIYSNKELLKAVGKDPDYIPESLEELEEVCQEMIKGGHVESGYTCAWPPCYLIEAPAAQQDLALVEPENEN